MGSPTSPTHGKHGAIYRLRPNGFKGNGLNDVTWGTAFAGAASAHYEVVIDAEGTPDTFKWRKNGGAWTETVAITGAAQTLDDGQTITFAATTGHTLSDQWVIGNLKDEACTESGTEAQITDATRRILNPNSPPTFTDSGGKNVLTIDYTQGKAVFDGNVTIVDVDGNNGFILKSGLEKVGYLIDWNFEISVDMVDISVMGEEWKTAIPGQAGGNGGANAFFIGGDSFFDAFEDCADGSQAYFFLELFNYDPDKDQTGDHFNAWVTFNSFNVNAPIGEVVKEAIGFQLHGIPSFTANV